MEGGNGQSSEDEYGECIRRLEIGAWGEHRSESQKMVGESESNAAQDSGPLACPLRYPGGPFWSESIFATLVAPSDLWARRQSTRFVALTSPGQETIHVRVHTYMTE
jgi:hypothetical protein